MLDSGTNLNAASHPFLSDSFTDISMRFIPFYLALVSLALDTKEKAATGEHKYKSDNARGIHITASSNSIAFKKEIKEGKC